MTVVGDLHEEYGATFGERGGTEIAEAYGRPQRAARAVRNVAGTIEMGYGVVTVSGEDRHEFVDDAVSNRVPERDGNGVYALLLDPQGTVQTDIYVYNAGERLLILTPPGRAAPLADDWGGKVFIQDVEIHDATGEFGIFGVHGPQATEKIASVLEGGTPPEEPLSFVRSSMHDTGVTVVATDNPLGEEGYEIICTAADARNVFETLLTRGLNAAPFGYRSWDVLTLEAGTPIFETELRGRVPNVAGVRNALDFEKGCYVGQEVVSKIENRGRPSRRLVGLTPGRIPESAASGSDTPPLSGVPVVADGAAVGEVTRAAPWSTLDRPLALALVDFDAAGDLAIRLEDEDIHAKAASLPFLEGSAPSARVPTYPNG
ncbi:aminomethyltransferase [Halalkaliarchaeum desulfuricum]|uniref:Aminomethyltransferase n=1 Tax=Halalkaliarchaeum desulfuricum TaxID=2055893 RepID=A0A343TLL2_9EURY|nr:glycine cleavage T C-terminal barrel domain-containing protein [Halalkaliarchaeum desulfuricum]AUX09984.1 aminomethyltransferase [Halalkaliarchaeum desulfuricum]